MHRYKFIFHDFKSFFIKHKYMHHIKCRHHHITVVRKHIYILITLQTNPHPHLLGYFRVECHVSIGIYWNVMQERFGRGKKKLGSGTFRVVSVVFCSQNLESTNVTIAFILFFTERSISMFSVYILWYSTSMIYISTSRKKKSKLTYLKNFILLLL